jgi:hypothetical protein
MGAKLVYRRLKLLEDRAEVPFQSSSSAPSASEKTRFDLVNLPRLRRTKSTERIQ